MWVWHTCRKTVCFLLSATDQVYTRHAGVDGIPLIRCRARSFRHAAGRSQFRGLFDIRNVISSTINSRQTMKTRIVIDGMRSTCAVGFFFLGGGARWSMTSQLAELGQQREQLNIVLSFRLRETENLFSVQERPSRVHFPATEEGE